MSREIGVIKNTGRKLISDLSFTEFFGSGQKMIQVTQGGGYDPDPPGFIQLTIKDAELLIGVLKKWTRNIA